MRQLLRDILRILTGSTFAERFIFNISFRLIRVILYTFVTGSEQKGWRRSLKQSIDLFGKDMIRREVKEVRVDTTVQEKNITFPTDRKLTEKVIEHCKRIAKKEDIKLKRTYGREIKKLKHQLRFARKPKNMKKHIKAQKRLHRIAFKIYNDLVKQLNPIPKIIPGGVGCFIQGFDTTKR